MESNLSFFSLPFIDNADVDFSKIKLECDFNDLHSTLPAHGSLLGTDDVLAQFLSGDELLEEPDLNGPTTLHCEICRKQFDNAKKYYGHLRVHSKDNLWICDKCPDQKFSTKQQLMKHSLTHKPLERVWRCPHCEISFEALWRLQQHLFAKHLDYKPHKCSRCEMSFQKLSDLKKHTDIHDGIKKHACDVCEMKFNDSSNLKRHMLTHRTEKPYPCQGCGNRFKQIASMKRHSKNCASVSQDETSTKDKTIRKNYCRICGKTFQYKSELLNHMNREHSKNPPPPSEAPKEDKSNELHVDTNNTINLKTSHLKKIGPTKQIIVDPANSEIILTTTVVNNLVTNINTNQPLNLPLSNISNNLLSLNKDPENNQIINLTNLPINLHTNITLPPQDVNVNVNQPLIDGNPANIEINSLTNIPMNIAASMPLNLHTNTEIIANSINIHANSVNIDHNRTVDNIVDDILSAEDDYLNRNPMANQILNHNPQETENHDNLINQIELLKEMNQMHILDDELLGHDLDFDSFQTMCNTNDMDYTDKNELLFDIHDGRSMDQDIMNALYQVKGENLPDLLKEPEIFNTTEKVNEYLVNPEVSVNECATIFESDVDLEASTNLAANLNQLIGENSVQYISTEHDDTFIISLNSEIDAQQLTDMLNIGVGAKVDNKVVDEEQANIGVGAKVDNKVVDEEQANIGVGAKVDNKVVDEKQANVEPPQPLVVKIDVPENAIPTSISVTKPLTIEIKPLKITESKLDEPEEIIKPVKKKKRTLYICRKCNKIFNKKDNYKSHRATHDPSLKQHACRQCEERFGYRSTLNKHVRRKHRPTTEPEYACKQCDQKYKAAWMLKRHIAASHERSLQYRCKEQGCGKLFYSQPDLNVHTRFHKGDRPYKCDICSRGFHMMSHLKRHIKNTDCTKRVKIEEIIKKKPTKSVPLSVVIANNARLRT